jgi:hypothetical protein
VPAGPFWRVVVRSRLIDCKKRRCRGPLVDAPAVNAQRRTHDACTRPQDVIADVEPAPPSPVEHISAHTASHAQPRPRAAEPPIPTGSRARSAARRALK